MKHLRFTPTNSADDSKGHSLGLEGDQFLYIIGGLVAGVFLLLACMKSGMSPGLSMVIAGLPIPLCALFLFTFKIGKPPRYTKDLLQKWTNKKSLSRYKYRENPYLETFNKTRKINETKIN